MWFVAYRIFLYFKHACLKVSLIKFLHCTVCLADLINSAAVLGCIWAKLFCEEINIMALWCLTFYFNVLLVQKSQSKVCSCPTGGHWLNQLKTPVH